MDARRYTGHAFGKTSATLLANEGVDLLGLKLHEGCKFPRKLKVTWKILYKNGTLTSATSVSMNTTATDTRSIPIQKCADCTFKVSK